MVMSYNKIGAHGESMLGQLLKEHTDRTVYVFSMMWSANSFHYCVLNNIMLFTVFGDDAPEGSNTVVQDM